MNSPKFEQPRAVGRRLRAWRGEQNWSGDEAAALLGERLGRPMTWPDLRRYERSEVLPDVSTAQELAALYGYSFGELLMGDRSTQRRGIASRSRRRLSDEAVHEMAAVAAANGCHEKDTQIFTEAGVSARELQEWLSTFSSDQAASWIEAGVSFDDARWWRSQSCSILDMQMIAEFEVAVDQVEEFRRIIPGGTRAAVVAVRLHRWRILSRRQILEIAAMGWDVLEAVPWCLAGHDLTVGQAWAEAGFTPSDLSSMLERVPADEAESWRSSGVPAADCLEWIDGGFSVTTAEEFDRRGFDVATAIAWTDHGFSPDAAESWRRNGLAPEDAEKLLSGGFDPEGVRASFAEGLGVEDLRTCMELGVDGNDLPLWLDLIGDYETFIMLVRAGLGIGEVRRYVDVGVDLNEIPVWHGDGRTPEDAANWQGFSLRRARLAIPRGLAPKTLRERQAEGRQRLIEAREQLSRWRDRRWQPRNETVETRTRSVVTVRAQPAVDHHCIACDRPIGVNGRCGCS